VDTEGEKDTKTTVTSDMLGEKQQEEEESLETWLHQSVAALQAALNPFLQQGELPGRAVLTRRIL
jgi:hypothetical protein